MNSKITKKCLIEIIKKGIQTANPLFRKFLLGMAKFTSVMPLFSLEAYLQTTNNITIPSESLIVNLVLSPKPYINIDRTSLITNHGHNTKQLGCLTLPIYSIFKMQPNQVNKYTGITDFITNQKTRVETFTDFFQQFINDTDDIDCKRQAENVSTKIYWPITTINHYYI